MVLSFHVPIRKEFSHSGRRATMSSGCDLPYLSGFQLHSSLGIVCFFEHWIFGFDFCNLLIFLILRKISKTKGPSSDTHPRPLRLGWTFSGTVLGLPVRRKPSHQRQGISTREGQMYTLIRYSDMRVIFLVNFLVNSD